MKGRDITQFLHNRYGAFFMILIAIAGVSFAYSSGKIYPIEGDYGLLIPSPNNWIKPGLLSMIVSIVLNLLVAFSAINLNKQFNTMRSLSMLVAGGFMIMQLSSPSEPGLLNGGDVMAVGMSLISFLLFSIFGDSNNTKRVFLMFFLIAVFALFEYSFLFYVPVIFIGLSQMRVFNLKTLVAALIGFITPMWILLGFGIITLEDIRMPDFVTFMAAINTPGMWYQLLIIAVTITVGLTFMAMNVMKMLSYNSRIRAANGFLTLLMISTILFMLIDYNNILVYVTLLNILVAYQIGHYFATHIQSPNSYIGILSMLFIYIAFFAVGLYI